ncbi:hypothetical protein LEMLEM_LOCUS316 [Lemmus lemmus]
MRIHVNKTEKVEVSEGRDLVVCVCVFLLASSSVYRCL